MPYSSYDPTGMRAKSKAWWVYFMSQGTVRKAKLQCLSYRQTKK